MKTNPKTKKLDLLGRLHETEKEKKVIPLQCEEYIKKVHL